MANVIHNLCVNITPQQNTKYDNIILFVVLKGKNESMANRQGIGNCSIRLKGEYKTSSVSMILIFTINWHEYFLFIPNQITVKRNEFRKNFRIVLMRI